MLFALCFEKREYEIKGKGEANPWAFTSVTVKQFGQYDEEIKEQ